MRSSRDRNDTLRTFAGLLGAALSVLVGAAQAESLYIDYSTRPNLSKLTAPTLCIVDPYARVDLKTAHERGHTLLAYISLVELAKGSPAEAAAQKRNVPSVGTNPDWNSRLLDVQAPAWAAFILDDCAAKASGMGFDGFFLDTLDSAERIAGGDAARLKVCQSALVEVIQQMDKRWPRARIIANRGFPLLPRLQGHLDGVLVESVYQGFDPATKRYHATDPAGVTWIENQIRAAQKLGLPVYAVDYASPSPAQRDFAKATAERLKKLGCVPLITTHGLTGEVLAP